MKWLATAVGALLTLVMVGSAFFEVQAHPPYVVPRFSGAAFLAEVPRQGPWLVGFLLLSLAVIPLRALQWQAALGRRVPFRERYHLVAMGAFVHNAVPGKLGDLFRALLLSRQRGFPLAEALGSVFVCKLLELAALLGLVALSLAGPFGGALEPFHAGVRAALLLCVAGFGLVLALAHRADAVARWLERRGRLPRVRQALVQLGAGVSVVRTPRTLGRALSWSVWPVLAAALAYGVGLWGLGVQGGVAAGAVVLGAIALGQATPGMPVGLGVYYVVTAWAARALGAAPEHAALYAVLTHAATVLSQVLLGAVSLRACRFRFRDLRREVSASGEAPDSPARVAAGLDRK